MEELNADPTVLIVGVSPDVAVALYEVVSLAHCMPIAADNLDRAAELQPAPVAIVAQVRSALSVESPHPVLADWPKENRPMVVALVSTDEDIADAERLGCEVLLRQPWQVRGLYDTLMDIARVSNTRS